jgi:dTDP-4-dehydrorhamnose 3,5-epimerase-like enzyme
MEIERSGIPGAWIIKFPVFADDRGIFREWFKKDEIKSKTDFYLYEGKIL